MQQYIDRYFTKEALPQMAKNLALDLIGCFIFSIGIYVFVNPAKIAPGGVSGMSIVIHHLFPFLPLGTLNFIINVPLLILSWLFLGRMLTIKSLRSILLVTVMIDIILPMMIPAYTGNRLLGSLFGGLLVGVGIGIIFTSGSTTGGTDIMSYLIKLKRPHVSIGRAFLIIDSLILLSSIYVFRDLESGMFGMISLFCTSRVVDSILYGTDKGAIVYVISKHTEQIADVILNDMNRGVTFLNGRGGYSGDEQNIIFCAVRRNEFPKLKNIALHADPNAFIIIGEFDEIIGEGFKAR